ncbi:E3 ubiquitin-protein ligase RKP isoform X2 [Wolffia australiana]
MGSSCAANSGLALLLSGEEDGTNDLHRPHIISLFDESRSMLVESLLEHIFNLPRKSLIPSKRPVDVDFVRMIVRNNQQDQQNCQRVAAEAVQLDKNSICGELKGGRHPLKVEGVGIFSSARATACVERGKWMYEVVLETAGVQQLGWATLACPFTDQRGVGDADDSYAFDGRRVRKWNKEARAYGMPWVVGDVIGCCIDLEEREISFYRNGVSLGIAFHGVRCGGAKAIGYYPAISLSQGERCELNFGGRPFKYPVDGFLPLQAPPAQRSAVAHLVECLSRVFELQRLNSSSGFVCFERLREMKMFPLLEELFYPISRGICEELFSVIGEEDVDMEYLVQGFLVPFLLEQLSPRPPHNSTALNRAIDLFLEHPRSRVLLCCLILVLSQSCRTAPLVLLDCPFSGSYPYLALACRLLQREELIHLWCSLPDFELSLEGFLSRKCPSKQDLQQLIPSDVQSSLTLTTATLSQAVDKIEELQRELCQMVMKLGQSPGSVFRTFVQNFVAKVRAAEPKMAWPGASSSSALVSLYMVILHFLSEGPNQEEMYDKAEVNRGFLHHGGIRCFPAWLLFKDDPYRATIPRLGGSFFHLKKAHPVTVEASEDITWEEGCLDVEETKVSHAGAEKPCCCCCSGSNGELMKTLSPGGYPVVTEHQQSPGCGDIGERSSADCSAGALNDEIVEKPQGHDQATAIPGYRPLQRLDSLPSTSHSSLGVLKEDELLDVLLLLFHLDVSSSFKQAFYYKSHYASLSGMLDEVDKQMREKPFGEHHRALREARNVYREELVDCIRQCAWYRASLYSWWKQRGTYALCVWVAELLAVLSHDDLHFAYIPEFYLETLVDCVLSLCRSDPPFASPEILIKQGLSSFVTVVAGHFDDPRIQSMDLKDLLLQSIAYLVRHRDYVAAFERNKIAVERMPRALLMSFNHRSWILIASVLNHLCGGSGFSLSKHEDSSSPLFQGLLQEACLDDEQLLPSFLNHLFNTLCMMITEFSILIRDSQDSYQLVDPQQRKCSIIFDLSCGLARILEFFTLVVPQAFLLGPDMNLRRLTELIVFVFSHLISTPDADLSFRRHGQPAEKTSRAMMLGPLVGIIVNLVDAGDNSIQNGKNDLARIFASMDCPAVHLGLEHLLGYSWAGDNPSPLRLAALERFVGRVKSMERSNGGEDGDSRECCYICCAAEADAVFEPCRHQSCFGCITRHLLNGKRCFFCNATVMDVLRLDSP